MKSKQLVFDAVNHRQPERLPWTLYLAKPLYDQLVQLWGNRQQWSCPSDDTVRIIWPVEHLFDSKRPDCFIDRFNCRWQREEGGYIFIEPPLSLPDVGMVPRINLITDDDVNLINKTRQLNPEAFIYYQFTTTFGEWLWVLRGMEQTLIDYLAEPEFVHNALDILMEMHMTALDIHLALPLDGITFGDDFGSQ